MKCGTYVKWVEKRRKGTGEPYQRLTVVAARHARELWEGRAKAIEATHPHPDLAKLSAEGVFRCQGKIQVKVTAVDEPYFGGCSAALRVETKCDTCGETCFPIIVKHADTGSHVTDLSSLFEASAELSHALEEYIEEMPEP